MKFLHTMFIQFNKLSWLNNLISEVVHFLFSFFKHHFLNKIIVILNICIIHMFYHYNIYYIYIYTHTCVYK